MSNIPADPTDHPLQDSSMDQPAAPLAILYRDEHLVAVDKPAGLLVHRSPAVPAQEPVLLQQLRDQLGQFLFPIHRLDRPTSGVIVYALQSETAARMNRLFSRRQVSKSYRAVVRGWPADAWTIELPLREKFNEEMEPYEQASRPLQPALTRLRTLARYEAPWSIGEFPTGRYAMVEATPITGRWHQIRRHLKHAAYPIIGDQRHGDHRHNRLFSEHWGLQRMLLVAERIAFAHPWTGQPIVIVAPLGEMFERMIQRLAIGAVDEGNRS